MGILDCDKMKRIEKAGAGKKRMVSLPVERLFDGKIAGLTAEIPRKRNIVPTMLWLPIKNASYGFQSFRAFSRVAMDSGSFRIMLLLLNRCGPREP